MQQHDTENEGHGQNQHNDGVTVLSGNIHAQTTAIIRVQTQHGARAAACTSSACAVRLFSFLLRSAPTALIRKRTASRSSYGWQAQRAAPASEADEQ